MSITAADKIFIGVDDEINFVVEKILSAEKGRVILVVPQNALIVSSLVSLRILAKQITKSKKLLVLVTEDEFGTKLAKTAGLISTNKVSNITPEVWESAQIAKEKAKSEAEKIKKELLANRGIGLAAQDGPEEPAMEDTETETTEDVEQQVTNEKEPEETGPGTNGTEEEKVEQEEQIAIDLPAAETVLAKTGEKDVKIKGPIQRTRRQPKMVDVGGFQIYAGGDINEVMSQDMQNNESPLPSPERLERPRVTVNKDKTNGFTSRDWSSYTNDPSPKFSLAKLFKRGDDVAPRALNPEEQKKKRKLIIAGVAIILFAILGAVYVLAFRLSTADVRITLKTAEVPVEQQMTIDTAVSQVDEENLIVPARVITEEDLSISASDSSTGEGAGGDVAGGVIDIWNKTTNQITIPAGTVIENTTTNLKYVIKEDVTVRAKNASDPLDIGRSQDVSVEAEKFGEEYNITESGTKTDFKVGTYATADVVGKRFRPIEGGTTRKFKAPSQADVDKVKERLVDSISKQGLNKIKNLVPEGYRLIEETAKFEESTLRSTPEVGKEGDSFSVTLEGKMTALVVANADLDKAISILIAKNQDNEDEDESAEFEVENLGDAEISNVVREGDKATFTVVSRGSLTSKVTEESIKQGIAGKSVIEAEEYLIKVSEIENSRVTFNPGFLPSFLHRIPTDWSRIKINFQ